MGKVYGCAIQNDLQGTSPDGLVIDSTSGEHGTDLGDHNVTGLFAHSKDLKSVPKNVEKYFENIRLIDINNCKIKKINQNDLKPFPKLIYCGFKDNQIEILENGIFDNNLELELISFWNNKIIQVGPIVFDHLTKLSWLYFDNNPCLNMRVENDRTEVLSMIEKASKSCKALGSKDIDELKTQLQDLKNAHESGLTAMSKTTEELAEKVKELEKNLIEAQQKILDLEAKAGKNNLEVKSDMETKGAISKNTISPQFLEQFEH